MLLHVATHRLWAPYSCCARNAALRKEWPHQAHICCVNEAALQCFPYVPHTSEDDNLAFKQSWTRPITQVESSRSAVRCQPTTKLQTFKVGIIYTQIKPTNQNQEGFPCMNLLMNIYVLQAYEPILVVTLSSKYPAFLLVCNLLTFAQGKILSNHGW